MTHQYLTVHSTGASEGEVLCTANSLFEICMQMSGYLQRLCGRFYTTAVVVTSGGMKIESSIMESVSFIHCGAIHEH